MNRRQFILTASGVAIATGTGAAAWWLNASHDHPALTLERALHTLANLSGREIRSTGLWTPFQIFSHCAQSIEYSLSGYPQAKPLWFQESAGSLAFSAFSAAGAMRHNLSETIPGADPLPAEGDVQAALLRLQQAFTEFRDFTGAPAPHFAYGALTKEQYVQAHVMHLNNHLIELTA